jgi:hypothetical protein
MTQETVSNVEGGPIVRLERQAILTTRLIHAKKHVKPKSSGVQAGSKISEINVI